MLFSRLAEKAAGITKRVTSAVSSLVTVSSPAEQFAESWAFIVSAHNEMVQAAHMAAASGGDVPVVSQRSPLAHHMLSLPRLFREEKQHSDGAAVVDLACFSLLTERKVVETLVAYTTEQVLPGLTMRALVTLAGIVQTVGVDLVAMSSVHRPLHSLLSSTSVTPEGLRFDATSSDARRKAASPARPLPVLQWNKMNKGLKLEAAAFIRLVSKLWRCVQRSVATAGALFDAFYDDGSAAGAAPSFALLEALQHFLSDCGKGVGGAARDCVLRMLRSQHPRLRAHVCTDAELVPALCRSLGDAFVAVATGADASSADLARFRCLLQFTDEVASSDAAAASTWLRAVLEGGVPDVDASGAASVAAAVLRHAGDAVFPRVRSTLLEGSEEQLTRATATTASTIKQLGQWGVESSVLLVPFMVALVGRLLPTESGADAVADDAAVCDALLERVCGLYEPLAVATLDLFGEVLALSCPLVVSKLVLQHLPPPPAIEDSAAPADAASLGGGEAGEAGGAGEDESKVATSPDSHTPPLCDRFFELFPDTSSLISDASRASLRAYVADASRRADGAHVSVEYWTKLLAQCHVDTSKRANVGKAKEDAGPHGPFLSAVFEKMMQLLDQSVDVNLSVTGVLSALIVYPDPNLHRTLFAPLYAPVAGDTGSESGGVARNVPSMMAALWRRALTRGAKLEGFDVLLQGARRGLSVVNDSSGGDGDWEGDPDEGAGDNIGRAALALTVVGPTREREFLGHQPFLEAVVVLEELVKDVSCALDVRERMQREE